MTYLLDVNLLVSLAWPNYVHHAASRSWLRGRGPDAWATTPVTESGFVRISSNRSAIPTAVTPSEALPLLAKMRSFPGHVFLSDDVELLVGHRHLDAERIVSHHLVTDAHLLALAGRHGARLATVDRGVAVMAGPRSDDIRLVPTPNA